MRIGKEERLRILGIVLMILVRVALVDVKEQVPLMLQAEMLEIIVVIAVMMVMRRRILKKSQMGLKPKRRV